MITEQRSWMLLDGSCRCSLMWFPHSRDATQAILSDYGGSVYLKNSALYSEPSASRLLCLLLILSEKWVNVMGAAERVIKKSAVRCLCSSGAVSLCRSGFDLKGLALLYCQRGGICFPLKLISVWGWVSSLLLRRRPLFGRNSPSSSPHPKSCSDFDGDVFKCVLTMSLTRHQKS